MDGSSQLYNSGRLKNETWIHFKARLMFSDYIDNVYLLDFKVMFYKLAIHDRTNIY